MMTTCNVEVIKNTVHLNFIDLLIKADEDSPVHAKVVYDGTDKKFFKKLMVFLRPGNIIEAKIKIVEDEYGMIFLFVKQIVQVLQWGKRRTA